MSTNKEMIENITSITEEIKHYYDEDLKKQIGENIINQKEKIELIDILISKTREVLTKIFGEEKKINEKNFSENFIKYRSTENVHSDAVIFNYWSYEGESIKSSISKTNQYKRNIFYKGVRWSNEIKSKAFYSFFNDIKEALAGDAPVDFFIEKAVNNKIESLKITGKKGIKAKGNAGFIQMPILFDESSNKVVNGIKSEKFIKLIEFIYELRKTNTDLDEVINKKNEQYEKLKNLKKIFSDAFKETKEKDKHLIEDWTGIFTSALNNEKTIDSKDVFNVVMAYQYYDHPYTIYIFSPSFEEGNKKQLYSCLVITLDEKNSNIVTYKTTLSDLSKVLGKVPELEKSIWGKRGQNLPNYWRWKREYDNFYDSYYRLSNVALNICLSICKRKDIDYFDIPSRVKNFDSFYNKIVNRANGRDEDFPGYGDFLTESTFIDNHSKIKSMNKDAQDNIKNHSLYQLWKNEFCEIYRKKILNPDKENIEYILHNLKDIAGLRIICLFRNDFNKFIKEIKHIKSNDIEIINSNNHQGEGGYRSYHLVIKLGEERKNIYELKDLSEEKCEIQIRTILDQGWADVSHKLFYKPNVTQRIIKEIRSKYGQRMKDQAQILRSVDDFFNGIRDEVLSTIKDSKLYIE